MREVKGSSRLSPQAPPRDHLVFFCVQVPLPNDFGELLHSLASTKPYPLIEPEPDQEKHRRFPSHVSHTPTEQTAPSR